MISAAAGEHAALAELEHQRLAAGHVVERRGKRPDPGVLVAEREARLALVGRDEVEILEIGDVAPAARHLAVGDLEHLLRNRLDQPRDGAPVEDTVAEIAEYHRVAAHLADPRAEALDDVIGDRAVVE